MTQSTLDDYQTSDAECPTCGDVFKNEHGMKIHHVRLHGESISGKLVECEWCDDQFRQDRYKAKRDQRHFCDYECMGKWRSQHFVEENATNHKGGRYVECRVCGADFWASPSQFSDRHPDQNPTYCSNECHGEALKLEYAGEGNPRWKGGEFSRGPGWGYQKSLKIRVRDQARCVDCGRSEKEVVNDTQAYLHVHHICGARDSTNPAVYNSQRNLVTLCVYCHRRWERHVPGVPPDITQNYDNRRISPERLPSRMD